MNAFLQLGLSNTLIAGAIACVAIVVARGWRNPHVVRALWLIVLVKLLMPPLVAFDWPRWDFGAMTTDYQVEPAAPLTMVATDLNGDADLLPMASAPTMAGAAPAWTWSQVAAGMVMVWLVGSFVVFAIGAVRILRFHSLLMQALPASAAIDRLVGELSQRVGLRRAPRLRLVVSDSAPFVWPLGTRSTIVVPLSLVNTLDRDSLADILLHELAHIRRGDHFVRWLEMAATTLHWWNPLLWLARRELHKVEEACCDAWVASEFPARRKSYAHSLLSTAELLLPCPRPAALALAAFSGKSQLARRVELLLRKSPTKGLSPIGMMAVAAVAVVVWPCAANWAVAEEPLATQTTGSQAAAESAQEPRGDGQSARNPAAIGAARHARFMLAAVSEDGKGVEIVRSVNHANEETLSVYKWAHLEVLNAKGEKLSREAAKKALAERRMVVVISGTQPIEAYAEVWQVLAADTPVIQLSRPTRKEINGANPPAKKQSIGSVGGDLRPNK